MCTLLLYSSEDVIVTVDVNEIFKKMNSISTKLSSM